MGRVTLDTFREKIAQMGGRVTEVLDNETTHIITAQSYEETKEWLKTHVALRRDPEKAAKMTMHSLEWMHQSLGRRAALAPSEFVVKKVPVLRPPPAAANDGAAEPSEGHTAAVSPRAIVASPERGVTEAAATVLQGDGVVKTVNERPCPPCDCGKPTVRVANEQSTSSHKGRLFFRCQSYYDDQADDKRCRFFEWVDEPPRQANFPHYDKCGYDYRPYLHLPRVKWGEVAPTPISPAKRASSEGQPIDNNLFLRYVDEDAILHLYRCPICMFPMINAHATPCKHSFCLSCLSSWLEKNSSCPTCRDAVTVESLQPSNKTLRDLLGSIEVYCPNEGCNWQGTRSNLDIHRPMCRHHKYRHSSDGEEREPKEKRKKMDPNVPPPLFRALSQEFAQVEQQGQQQPQPPPGQDMVEEKPSRGQEMVEEEPPQEAEAGSSLQLKDSHGRVIVDDEDRVEINQRRKRAARPGEEGDRLHRLSDVVDPQELFDAEDDNADYAARPSSPPTLTAQAIAAVAQTRVYSQYTPPSSDEDVDDALFVSERPTGNGFRYLEKEQVKPNPYLERNKKKWAAANPNAHEERSEANLNKELSEELKTIAKGYEASRDQWRARAHNLAAAAVARHTRRIDTVHEASLVHGVGSRILVKIGEFLTYGQTRKTRLKDDDTKAREELGKVHGIGPAVLDKLWSQGIRSVAQLREMSHLLTPVQTIGLKYMEEFQVRIPREEVAEIEAVITRVAHEIDPKLVLVTCGSYRRGKESSGDIDILITHKMPDKNLQDVLGQLVGALMKMGLVTDALTHADEGADKWMGVCQLRPDMLHRRLDFQLIARESWPFALLYFTGSEHFNRSMRHWAGKLGLSLSQHALVVRPTAKHVKDMYKMEGVCRINCDNERDVFTALKLEYMPPNERDV